MKKRLINALDICLQSIDAGVSLEECIIRYPEFADELRNLLQTAEILKRLDLEQIPIDSMRVNESKILLQASIYRNTKKPGHLSLTSWISKTYLQFVNSLRIISPLTGKIIMAVSIAVVLIFISGGLMITSAKSIPGEALYPVKRVVEDIKIYLAANGEIRHEYEDRYSKQRVEEVNALFAMAREQRISFEGIVLSTEDTQWNVSGIPIVIQPDTTIIIGNERVSLIGPGMRVEVEGQTTKQGQVLADEIHLREYEFTGLVEKIDSNDWQISGFKFNIPSYVHIDTGIRVGDEVTILIRSDDEGLFVLAIQKNWLPTESPTENLTLEVTPTPIFESAYEEYDTYEFIGIVDEIDVSYWTINGVVYHVNSNTEIEGNINIGDTVSGKHRIENDGSFVAIEINLSENDDHEGQETPEEVETAENPGNEINTPDEA